MFNTQNLFCYNKPQPDNDHLGLEKCVSPLLPATEAKIIWRGDL